MIPPNTPAQSAGHQPNWTDLREWLANPPPPPRAFIRDPIANATIWTNGAAGFLQGPEGVGKTWLLLELALSAVSGAPAFGRFEVERGPVFLVLEEGAKAAIFARLAALMRGRGISPDDVPPGWFAISHGCGWKTDDPDSARMLAITIDDAAVHGNWPRRRPVLVGLDCFYRLHDSRERDPDDMSALVRCIDDNVRRPLGDSVSVLILHHARKRAQGEGADARPIMRGSSVLGAWADHIVTLNANRDAAGAFEVRCDKARDSEPFETFTAQLHRDPDTARLRYVEGDLEDAKVRKLADRVTDALEKHPGGLIVSALRDRLKIKNDRLRRALDMLESTEAVRWKKEGNSKRYWLN